MLFGASRHWRALLPLILIGMILMRLVWMQLRAYPIAVEARALFSLQMVADLTAGDCQEAVILNQNSETQSYVVTGAARRAALAFASPGFTILGTFMCRLGRLTNRDLLLLNQMLLAATVFTATLLCRFLTSSWTVALIVAAMLMSRGRMLTDIGTISIDHPMMVGVMTWLTILGHFLRTGSTTVVVSSFLILFVAVLFDSTALILPLAPTFLLACGYLFRRQLRRPLLRKLREMNKQLRHIVQGSKSWAADESVSVFGRLIGALRQMLGVELFETGAMAMGQTREEEAWTVPMPQYDQGGLLRTLTVPFTLWIYARRRWLTMSCFWIGSILLATGIWVATSKLYLHSMGVEHFIFWPKKNIWPVKHWSEVREALTLWQSAWWPMVKELWTQHFDLHLVASILIVALCAVQAPGNGLQSFFEMTWLLIVTTLFLFGAALIADFYNVVILRQMLADGVAGASLVSLGPRGIVTWLEPAWLTMGAAGVYNLMKVFDTRMA